MTATIEVDDVKISIDTVERPFNKFPPDRTMSKAKNVLITKVPVPFSLPFPFYAYAKADNWLERTFNTKAEQDAFHRNILKVVPPYTNDGPGLNTQLVTR